MTKEEKIKEAYGEHWNIVKDRIDENGFIRGIGYSIEEKAFFKDMLKISKKEDWDEDQWQFRPKSLRGINDNNGWTKIEKETDLPDIHDLRMYMPCEFGKPRPDYSINSITIRNGFQAGVISHYRLIEMVPNPLY